MTEYAPEVYVSWDNFIKEHTTGIIRYSKEGKPGCSWETNISKFEETLEGYWSTIEDRVKDLERKINPLESDKNFTWTHSDIMLERRIEDLEEWKNNSIHPEREQRLSNLEGWHFESEKRIDKLEKWKTIHAPMPCYSDNVLPRLKDLEEWKQRIFRDFGYEVGEGWIKGGYSIPHIVNRLDKLEEWKRQHIAITHEDAIHIDKKVWEKIKSNVALLDPNFYVSIILNEAIKKAEGGE